MGRFGPSTAFFVFGIQTFFVFHAILVESMIKLVLLYYEININELEVLRLERLGFLFFIVEFLNLAKIFGT